MNSDISLQINELQKLHTALTAIPGIVDIHALHVWALNNRAKGLAVNMAISNQLISDTVMQTARGIAHEYGIANTSIHIHALPCRTIWETIKGYKSS